jgi:hypothetical protein
VRAQSGLLASLSALHHEAKVRLEQRVLVGDVTRT